MKLHSSKSQNLSAKQIVSVYLNLRLIYIYFRFWKNKRPLYWNFCPGCDFDHMSVNGMLFCIRVPNFIQIAPSAAEIWHHIDFFKDGGCGGYIHVLPAVSLLLMSLLQKVKFYHQTKFRRYSSIHGWDISTSVLEKETSAILEFYFRFRFRLYYRNRHVILHQAAKYHLYRTTHCWNMTSIFQDASRGRSILLPVSSFHTLLPSECQNQWTKFLPHISNHGWDITTSGFEKQTLYWNST